MFKPIGRALALVATLLACAPLPALAQTAATTLPRGIYEPSGRQQVATQPVAIVTLDSVSSAPCIVGSVATCVLPGSGGGGGGGFTPFTLGGTATLAVTTSSQRVALPSASPVVILVNSGAADAWLKLGNSSVTSATTDFYLGAGRVAVLAVGSATHVASLTSAGSTSLYVATGSGQPVISGGGGSGGGTVTIGAGSATIGTVNLGTLNGAATAAKQDVEAAKLDTLIAAAQDTTPVSVKIDQTTVGTTDSVTVKNMGAGGTGITAPTGGSGLLGFLSGVFDRLGNVLQVGGNVGHGVSDSGNPVKMGCVYKSSPGAVSTGFRADVLCSPAGAVATYIGSPAASTVFATVQGLGLGTPSGNNVLHVQAGMLNNNSGGSTSVEAGVTIPAVGLNRSGAGVQATAMAATNDAGQAIPRTVSGTSAVAGMQLCSAACNWFGGSVTAAAAGYYIIYDQSSGTAPADGTQTWAICRAIGVGTTTFSEFRTAPARFTTGAYAVKSSTGCGTKTAVTDAFFESYAVQ